MRLHRFFVEEKIEEGKEFILKNEEQIHQIAKVFRLGVGDEVVLFDGSGFDFVSKIIDLEKKEIIFSLNEKKEAVIPKNKIHLFLSAIRKERFEWAAEKATELGVSSITPIITSRSEHTHLNFERLKKIVIEASEQCGRGDIPEVNESIELEKINFRGEVLVADFDGVPFPNLQLSTSNFQLFVGPEGGWSDEERKFFKENLPAGRQENAKFVSLGELTLRAETAAISFLSKFI